MGCVITSFAILLTLVAFDSNVTNGAQVAGAGTSVGAVGAAGAPALPPVPVRVVTPTLAPALPPAPMPASTPTLAPAPPPAPDPTLSPGFVPNRAPAGQVRAEFGNSGAPQTPIAGPIPAVPNSANTGVAGNPGDQWRYRQHNGTWWYWTPDNRWVYRNGNQWINYEPAVAAVPDPRYTGQPGNGYYQSSPIAYPAGPYPYSTGYGGYYGPVYRGGYYYGSGGYYGQPGISVGLGFGRGIRIGF